MLVLLGPLPLAAAFFSYWIFLALYTTLYRISPLHPLSSYPGPFLARVSKVHTVYIVLQGKQHLYYKRLHSIYGNVVRVGPNELSINEPSLIHEILGHGGLPKGPFWDPWGHPPTLIATRDVIEHAHRRKAWSRALTTSAINDYESIVSRRAQQLVNRWKSLFTCQLAFGESAALIDIAKWMGFFTADFMGDMAFGGGFELMRDGKDTQGMWGILESGVNPTFMLSHNRANSILAHVPWFGLLYRRVVGGSTQRLRNFARENVQRRLKLGASRKDLFHHLNDEEGHEPMPPSIANVCAEGTLAIVAGADTTSTTMTGVFYNLLRRPEAYRRLRQEIEAMFPDREEPLDSGKLGRMEWLNGCINESLRLYPPVASGSQRRVERGAGPKLLGSYLIPGETQLFLPTYTMQRDPANFVHPDIFLPERWLPNSRIGIHNAAAFIPFSYGTASCVGKGLAMLEMRMLIVRLVQTFDFHVPSGVPGRQAMDWEDTLQDFFALQKGPLPTLVSLRK
ncbi:cytochrome P450 [Vararia minispora EC-137]|uniref:Cytochrome P450 n=1 Tax=Vararia minispora EC-137 TaxID=1314806 RepID=A0ACB8QR08_9AGAM|nr:cytochrome P450 [Vararia minispora EC-137]